MDIIKKGDIKIISKTKRAEKYAKILEAEMNKPEFLEEANKDIEQKLLTFLMFGSMYG